MAPARLYLEAKDILLWPDGFWCFREELSPAFLRDDKYAVVMCNSDEWLTIISNLQAMSLRSQ